MIVDQFSLWSFTTMDRLTIDRPSADASTEGHRLVAESLDRFFVSFETVKSINLTAMENKFYVNEPTTIQQLKDEA